MVPSYNDSEIKRGFPAPRGSDYTSEEGDLTLLSMREPLIESK
jgi:hypothetical protein